MTCSSFSSTKHFLAFCSSTKTCRPSSGESEEERQAMPSWEGTKRVSVVPDSVEKSCNLQSFYNYNDVASPEIQAWLYLINSFSSRNFTQLSMEFPVVLWDSEASKEAASIVQDAYLLTSAGVVAAPLATTCKKY